MRSKFKWIFTLLLAFSMQFSFAQEKTITGVVSDQTGPLPMASVVVKGTTRGTQTDMDGKYSIQASAGETLVVSYTGYTEFSAVVGASNTINASLQAGVDLSEVLVEGAVGIVRRADAVTSSFQVTKARELTQAANPSVIQSLVGKVSGLQINTTNSSVNSSTRIVIRGPKSITGNNEALVVIDGAVSTASTLSSLPPEVVESVTTLKGAQGSALYGSLGSNGVLIVTTKKGSGGAEKLTVSVNSSMDFQSIAYLPQRQTRYGQGWDGQHYSFENGTWGPAYDGSMQPVGLPQADGSYIMSPYSARDKGDNIKDFFKTGVIQQYGVSLSSGTSTSYNLLSINKQNRDFVVGGDVLDRTSFLFKAGREVGKFFYEGNVNYSTQRTDQANSDLYGDLIQTAPNVNIKQFENVGNEHNYSYYILNPYWSARNDRSSTRSDLWNASAKIKYTINDNINVSYLGNIRSIQNNSLSFVNGYTDPYAELGGTQSVVSSFSTFNENARNIYSDLLVNFDYNLTDDISLKANIGNNIQDSYTKRTTVGGSNLVVPGLYNVSNITGTPVATNTFTRNRSYAFLANVDLSYKEYLNLNLTSRYEVNSVLPKDNNDYFYPSAGLSFIPTKAFDIKGDVLNYAKIYVNYTRVGKADINAYALNNLYTTTNSNSANGGTTIGAPNNTGYPFNNLASFIQTQSFYDPNLKPEFYTTKEIGFGVAFFNDRLTLDAAAYRSDNKNLITQVSTSSASGATSSLINIGQTKTTGFEIDLGFTPIKTDSGFRWDNRLSYSTYETKVIKVTDQSSSVALATGYNTASLGVGIFAEEGENFPIIKGTSYERDDQGRVIIDAATGNPQYSTQLKKLANVNPDYILGYNTSFEYKGIRLSATMDYRTGGSFYSYTKQQLAFSGYLTETAQDGRTGFVYPNAVMTTTAPGVYVPNTSITGGSTIAGYASYINNQYTKVAENFVLDATAFKVRELALSYSFPSKLIENTGLQTLQFGINARNPFTVLPKANNGYSDPESSTTSGNGGGLAFNNQYPATRTFGFSLNLTF